MPRALKGSSTRMRLMLREGGFPMQGEHILCCHGCQMSTYVFYGYRNPRDAFVRRLADQLESEALTFSRGTP